MILSIFSWTSWPFLCLLWKTFSSKIHFLAFNLTYNPWPTLFCKVVSGVFLNWQLRYIESVSQFSHSVMSDSLGPHGLQHTRLPCPSPAPRACSNSCPSCQWCHPAISPSVVPFSSCLQSFPASGSFPMSQFFASGGQSTGVSASASVLPIYFLRYRTF